MLKDTLMPTPTFPPLPHGPSAARIILDGPWRYAPAVPHEGPVAPLPADALVCRVPGEFVMQGLPFDPNQPALVEYEQELPANWHGQAIRLRGEAIYAECAIWVNGQLIGQQRGGFLPFDLDITSVVQFGALNKFSFVIRNNSQSDTITFGSGYVDRPIAGILRPVILYALPLLHMRRLISETDLHTDGAATLRLLLECCNQYPQPAEGATLTLELHDPDQQPVAGFPQTHQLPVLDANATWAATLEFPIPQAQTWDSEHPRRYTLKVSLSYAGAVHQNQRSIGVRTLQVRDRRLWINGLPVKLRGINRHDAHPLHGRAAIDGLARQDVAAFKAAHVNFIRTSHYPPPLELVEACDEIGMLVEVEAPVCFAFGMFGKTPAWERWTAAEQQAASEFVADACAVMVEYYRSHPSVIIWSIGNESVWVSPFEHAAQVVKAADRTRPITFNWERHRRLDEGICEIGVEHYPAAGDMATYAELPRPILFDEYCHLPVYNRDELFTDPGLHEQWGALLLRQWDEIYALENGLGGSIWSGIDDWFLVPSAAGVRVRGYGSWGPLDGWRRAKPELWHVRKVYSPVRMPLRDLMVDPAATAIELPIQNRSDFSDLCEYRITWQIGTLTGDCPMALAPHSNGVLTVVLPAGWQMHGTDLQVTIRHADGSLIDSHTVRLSTTIAVEMPHLPRVAFEVHAGQYRALATGGTWRIDPHTGQISASTNDGRAVLLSGPTLALIARDGFDLNTKQHDRNYRVDDLCSGWQLQQIGPDPAAPQQLLIAGSYREATGTYRIAIDSAGILHLHYAFRANQALTIWQRGIALLLDPACDTLTWQRTGLWSEYPADHIGRPYGSAHAYRQPIGAEPAITTPPTWGWHEDQTTAGTNDFRSAKCEIIQALAFSQDGRGVRFIATGTQHVRMSMEGYGVRMLCLDDADHGSEFFLRSFAQPIRLQEGDWVHGSVQIALVADHGRSS
ncbi:MAG: hypothetical protein Fur005_23710 [Roseiflexaceae bacterium]